jgi:hypothetical protein
MVTLSYGAPNPALASGAAAVYLADAIWRGAPALGRRSSLAYAGGAVIIAGIVAGMSVHVRTHDDYGVLRGDETWSLPGNASGVRMDKATATYLADVDMCVHRYPAKWAAALPEGALADAVYGLRNPFPLDWFWPADYAYANGRQRLLDAATEVNRRGNYLLLMQTNAFPGAPIPGQVQSFIYDRPLGQEIIARLTNARRIPCGQFVAFYDPA